MIFNFPMSPCHLAIMTWRTENLHYSIYHSQIFNRCLKIFKEVELIVRLDVSKGRRSFFFFSLKCSSQMNFARIDSL